MLYGVSPKRLNEQVKRNRGRFPEDFMFQLSNQEGRNLRSQFATATVTDIAYSLATGDSILNRATRNASRAEETEDWVFKG